MQVRSGSDKQRYIYRLVDKNFPGMHPLKKSVIKDRLNSEEAKNVVTKMIRLEDLPNKYAALGCLVDGLVNGIVRYKDSNIAVKLAIIELKKGDVFGVKDSCDPVIQAIANEKNLPLYELVPLINNVARLIRAMGAVKHTESVFKLCNVLANKITEALKSVKADTDLSVVKESCERLIQSMGLVKDRRSEKVLTRAFQALSEEKTKQQTGIKESSMATLKALVESNVVTTERISGIFLNKVALKMRKDIEKSFQNEKPVLGLHTDKSLSRELSVVCVAMLGKHNVFPSLSEFICDLAGRGTISEEEEIKLKNKVDQAELDRFCNTLDLILALYKQTQDFTPNYTVQRLAEKTITLISYERLKPFLTTKDGAGVLKKMISILARLYQNRLKLSQ